MYDTDRGIEELARRRGDEEVTLEWLAGQLVARRAMGLVHPRAGKLEGAEEGLPAIRPVRLAGEEDVLHWGSIGVL